MEEGYWGIICFGFLVVLVLISWLVCLCNSTSEEEDRVDMNNRSSFINNIDQRLFTVLQS